MLYFMGLNESSSGWTGNFTAAMAGELSRRKIQYTPLPPIDWQTTTPQASTYLNAASKPEDTWFISWAQSPAIELIKDKPGRKFGLVVGLTAMPYEPAVLQDSAETLREPQRLHLYDHLFANSHWCRQCLLNHYPDLQGRVSVTGFPLDFNIYHRYLNSKTDDDLVVFNQRFSIEKLHVLEVELARMLSACGYRVQHLTGVSPSRMKNTSSTMSKLLLRAENAGLNIIFNESKHQYHQRLARATVVVTTSVADMLPSSLIEAVYLGAVPVAPNHMCFDEFIHPDNLYSPYDIGEILSIIKSCPDRSHDIKQYEAASVVERFLHHMDII